MAWTIGNKTWDTKPSFYQFKRDAGYNPDDLPSYVEDQLGQLYNKTFGKETTYDQSLMNKGNEFLNKPTGNYLGNDYDYLTDTLKNILNGGLPNRDRLEQAGKAAIGNSTNQAIQRTKENLASSGLYRSGVGQSAISNIYGSQADALSNLELGLDQAEINRKNEAISQLLGLNQFGAQSQLQERGQNLGYAQFLQQLAENARQFQIGQDNQPSALGQILGSLISAGGTVGAALSDKNLKENIKYTGEKTKDGIPLAEFNFKGDKTRLKGVIAQDVKKIIPDAVVEMVRLDKVPEAKYELVED